MEKKYTKILWKIEELWNTYYSPVSTSKIDISINYNDGISKYYSKFHLVEKFNFTQSKSPVFTDDYGEYLGLYKNQVLSNDGKNIYLFDNHNEMLYPMVEIATRGDGQLVYNVVHIDAHPDDAEFQGQKIKTIDLENVAECIQQTRISDFFDAIDGVFLQGAKQPQQLLGNIFRVTHSNDFEFFLPPEEPYILSLDIDIFGPEGDFAELHDKVRAIALAWGKADAVCIATSPGFIDQEFAQKIIDIFVK